MKEYRTEREGQLDFFEKHNMNFENNYDEEVLKDNTDGIFRGGIFEFKANINDLNKILFQTIKYLSKERIKGHNVPANIFLIDLNKNIAYEYKSKDYYNEIHKVYSGGASKENQGFVGKPPRLTLFLNKIEDSSLFDGHIQEKKFLKIDIDENCIVGWAERFYKENPFATKKDFLKDDGELRKPDKFKEFINPYKGESNEKFKYIMDKLNDKINKKKLGAFYTPIPYCKKAAELVRDAIKRVPEGNDYIILDTCCGTGNLESVLTDEELSHCVLNTYEYFEWLVLRERLEDKVRMILPKNKENFTFENGLIKENDALNKEFIKNEYIRKFLDDPKCTIIMIENPPYIDETSNGNGKALFKEKSFVLSEMKKEIKGRTTNELANRFIWKAFKYYINSDTDSLILFSPIKYWKSSEMINQKLIKGFIFNRKHFHASESAICCIEWSGKKDNSKILEDLEIYDIVDNELYDMGIASIKRCYKPFSDLFYEQLDPNIAEPGLHCEFSGIEVVKKSKIRVKAKYDETILGYLIAQQFDFGNPSLKSSLTRCSSFNGNGFYLTKANYLKKLPLFSACHVNFENFSTKGNIYTTSDGGKKYEKDQIFLKSCLIYTSLCQFNKCFSFKGSDGKDYYNEICFDILSNHKPQALTDLKSFKQNKDERALIKLWNKIIKEASQTKNYKKEYSYGLYQIIQELNTFYKTDDKKNVYDYPILNGDINSLKVKLRIYHKKYIEPKCFKYELLK